MKKILLMAIALFSPFEIVIAGNQYITGSFAKVSWDADSYKYINDSEFKVSPFSFGIEYGFQTRKGLIVGLSSIIYTVKYTSWCGSANCGVDEGTFEVIHSHLLLGLTTSVKNFQPYIGGLLGRTTLDEESNPSRPTLSTISYGWQFGIKHPTNNGHIGIGYKRIIFEITDIHTYISPTTSFLALEIGVDIK